MTITATDSEISYAGNGVTVAFAIPFVFDTSSDLKVLSTDSNGSVSELISGFVISGGGGSTGTCTFTTAPAVGVSITILDDPDITQPTDYTDNDAFPAESHEDALDRQTRISKRLYQLIKRCLRTEDGDPIEGDAMVLGSVDNRKGKYLFFNAVTGAIEYAVALVTTTLSRSIIAQLLYPQSSGESNAGATVVNYEYPYGWIYRFKTNTTPGVTDMQTAFQSGIDSADLTYPKVRLTYQNVISKPLLLRSISVENLVIEGEARTISEIQPSAISIAQPAQNVNCLIFNQCDNGHLHLKSLRFSTTVAHTGVILYAYEGGGADGSGQAAFSTVIDDVWFSMSSQNSGYMVGGFSNLKCTNCVYETAKTACWNLQGPGNGDQIYMNQQMFICYDAFILANDSNDKAVITVDGLNCYSHLRGRLIEINKGKTLKFSNITMEPDAANLGDTGLFKFTDCSEVLADNFSLAARTGVPAGAVGIEIVNGFSGKFVNGTINATTGIKFTGTGTIDAEFTNVDFTGCTTCVDFNAPAGTLSGKVKFSNCKFNDAQLRCLVHTTGTINLSAEFDNCEFLNAGLGGNAASRCVDLTVAGNFYFFNCKIGRTNGSAAAAYFVSQAGAGEVKFYDPIIVGTPPTGLTDTPNTVEFQFRRGDGGIIASAATVTLPYYGDSFKISGTTNITTLTATARRGNTVRLIFQGALTFTDGSNLALAGNFVTTADDSITLYCDGTTWFECARAVN